MAYFNSIQETARRLREATGMGDVEKIIAIAEDVASRSSEFSPFQGQIRQLVEDFDFDGILRLADALEDQAGP